MRLNKFFLMILIMTLLMAACGLQATPSPTSTPGPPTPTTPPAIKLHLIPGIENLLNEKGKNKAFTGAVLIAYQGDVLLSQGLGMADRQQEIANTPQTRFPIGTFVQQFTATSILMLYEQGKLDLQDSICDYLPECPAAWQPVTLHHLLAWNAGIPDYGNEENESNYYDITSEELASYYKDKPLDYPPGENWTWYPTPNNILLGHVIEQVSGESFEDFVQNQIFTPLGMVNTGFDSNPSGLALGYTDTFVDEPVVLPEWSNANFSTTLYSTVEDLFLFDQALIAGQLISPDLVDRMMTSHTAKTDIEGFGFGYNWWVIPRTEGKEVVSLVVLDGYQGINKIYPDKQIIMIILGNQGNRSAEELEILITDLLLVNE